MIQSAHIDIKTSTTNSREKNPQKTLFNIFTIHHRIHSQVFLYPKWLHSVWFLQIMPQMSCDGCCYNVGTLYDPTTLNTCMLLMCSSSICSKVIAALDYPMGCNERTVHNSTKYHEPFGTALNWEATSKTQHTVNRKSISFDSMFTNKNI